MSGRKRWTHLDQMVEGAIPSPLAGEKVLPHHRSVGSGNDPNRDMETSPVNIVPPGNAASSSSRLEQLMKAQNDKLNDIYAVLKRIAITLEERK
jgi:hypothetical protein